MPNQRAKNKLYLGGFVDKRFHAALLRQARQAGMHGNKFGFATQMVREALKSRGAAANGKVARGRG